MTDREKLVELLEDIGATCDVPIEVNAAGCGTYEIEGADYIADHLLAHGVIVLPCKVGDTVYDIYEAKANGEGEIRVLKVTDIHIHLDKRNKVWLIVCGYYFAVDDFGKTVFLTREEAEAALRKEGQ